ncbi:MAG TPA: GntR family transcriptional regulator [Clostridiaceae bacterium]|nr:GntR family transcriptional regulator [Clostridiaceae bacterium]
MSEKTFDLCAIVRNQLEMYMEEAIKRGQKRLPPEKQLSDKLQVSRSTVRTVLSTLEYEGKITRRHGSGTFINPHAFKLHTTLYPQVYYYDLIKLSGYVPSIKIIDAKIMSAGKIGTRLDIAPTRKVFQVRKLYLADGKACILCVDYLICSHFRNPKQILAILQSEPVSIFQILQKYTNMKVGWDVIRLEAADRSEVQQHGVEIESARPFLVIDSVNYSNDQPVLYAKSYVNTDIIKFYIVRGQYEAEQERSL